MRMNDELSDGASHETALVSDLLTRSYEDLSNSVRVLNGYLPSREDVLTLALTALRDGWVMITKVNSERQVEELLDAEGQLRLRTPLNIFIGGQILDRGVTIANLIGFFYGRRPQVYQQDTVLQHSRMFGFRPIEDLAVTRFYTEPRIYDAMRRMHESDVALRRTFETSPDLPVVFIQRDDRGRVIPCSPNKILVSNTTTLTPFTRILPVGFQTDAATRLRPITNEIDQLLDRLRPDSGFDAPFEITLDAALQILGLIKRALKMETDEGYNFDWDAAAAALTHMSNSSDNSSQRGHVWCLVRKDRNISRTVGTGSHAFYSDAPDTTRTEGNVARQTAVDIPMLIMLRQNGEEDKGWHGAPFYWPVIVAQQNIRTAIFAHETTP